MGIQNQDGALWMATGIDNSGLYKGKQEAMGIIRSMASEVTSFDIFAGIGTSAAIAFAQAAKSSYDFAKEYQKSMKEVATISSEISNNLSAYQQSLIDLTTEVPISANESAKALYGIVSAGYDGANGLKMLEVSAKAAVGGVTDTATAADGMTSIMNAYRISMDKAEEVSDQLFTTVRLGKTTFGEISASISQAAPTAAAFGVELDQLLGALATITKTGTPTAQAMTQIRAAIQATSNYLGDAAFEGRSFQEALQLMYEKAGGSASKLKEMLGTDEALAAVLKITGDNAKGAAADLQAVGESAGASEEAFKKMADTADSQLKLLTNNITAALAPMGTAMLEKVQNAAQAFNEAFANGDAAKTMKTLTELTAVGASAFALYKGSIIGVSKAKAIHATITQTLLNLRKKEATDLVLLKGLWAADATNIARNTSMRVFLTRAIKDQTKAMAKNVGAIMTNPYILATAAITGLGYAIYKYATAASVGEKAQQRLNERIKAFNEMEESRRSQIDKLITTMQDENETALEKAKAYERLSVLSPELIKNYTQEEIATGKLADAQKALNKERDDMEVSASIGKIKQYKAEIESLNKSMNADIAAGGSGLYYARKISQSEANIKVEEGNLNRLISLQTKAKEESKPIEIKLFEAKSRVDDIQKEYDEVEKKLKEEEQKFANRESPVIDVQLKVRYSILSGNLNDAKDNYSLIQQEQQAKEKTAPLYYEEYQKAKKEWMQAKKEYASIIKDKSTTVDAFNAASKKLESAKKEFEGMGGKTDNTDSELKNRRITAELALNAERLAIMEDGRKKRLLLSEQEHSEKKVALDKEYKETVEAYKKAGSVIPESITTTYSARIVENDNAKNKRDSQIEKESNKEFAEMQRALTDVYLTEEGKRLSAIKDRYDKQREWAKQQFAGGNMDKEQFSSFVGKIDAAQSQENLQSLLEQYRNWYDKRLQIENDFNDQLNTLESGRNDNNSEEIDKATKQLQESKKKALSQLSLDELKDGDLWVKMFSDLDKLAIGTLENILEKAKTVNTSAWDPEQVKEYEDAIQRLTNAIESRNPFKSLKNNWGKMMDGLKSGNKDDVASGLNGISSATDKINGDLNKIAGGIGDIFGDEAGYAAEQVVELTSAIGGFASGAQKIASGDIIGGIADVVSSVGKIFSMGKQVKEMNKAAREENQKFYDEAKKGELEYQMLIRERLRLEQQIGESMMGYNKRITEELEKQKKANADSFNEKWNKLQGESYISGKGYKHGTWFRKAKTWNEYDSLAGKSYDDIEKLYMEGKLDGKAKELFEELQRLKDEGVDIDKMMAENAEAFNEYVSGMSFDGAKDSLRSFLLSANGEIQDLADNFEDAMRNAIVNMIIDNVMGDRLKKWYDDFAEFMKNKDSMTEEEREKRKQELQNDWTQIGKDSQAAKDEAFDAAGITDKRTQTASSGGFQNMSQDTGDELKGRFTALLITGEEIKKQVMTQTDIQQQTLNHIVKLAVCPEYMSEMRDINLQMSDKMDLIEKNCRYLVELPIQTSLLKDILRKL